MESENIKSLTVRTYGSFPFPINEEDWWSWGMDGSKERLKELSRRIIALRNCLGI